MAAVLVTLSNASAFADSRHRNETDSRGRNDVRDDSRRNVTSEGRVRSVDRDRDGFRVRLDRGDYSFYVPQSALQDRGRNNLRVGVSMRFTGILDSNNDVYVSSADFLGYGDDYYRDGYDRYRYGNANREYVRGVVERVDVSRGTLLLREDRTGRRVSVVMPGGNRNQRGADLNDLRRGDVVTLSGDWHRGRTFEAYRIEGLRTGGW